MKENNETDGLGGRGGGSLWCLCDNTIRRQEAIHIKAFVTKLFTFVSDCFLA